MSNPLLFLPMLTCLQLPSFNDLRYVSLLGALMSAVYCTIAIVMSGTVRPGPDVNYLPAAVARSPIERVMGVFNAMTTVFFAYGGHNVALEIQATIPSESKAPTMYSSTVPAMMRGVNVTFVITGKPALAGWRARCSQCLHCCSHGKLLVTCSCRCCQMPTDCLP